MSARILLILLVLVLAEVACVSPDAARPTPPPQSGSGTPEASRLPTVSVTYEESGQVELRRENGQRIYIDVWNGSQVAQQPSTGDVLLLTHSEREDAAFQDGFPGQKVIRKAGTFTFGDVKIVSVEGSHTDDAPMAGDASNYMMVIEVDGFRIAALGEEGEESLSPEQLSALGSIDLAIAPLTNVGGLDSSGHKAIDVLEQLKPTVVLASFTDLDTAKLAAASWRTGYSTGPVTLRRDRLPSPTFVLFLGRMAESYGSLTGGGAVSW